MVCMSSALSLPAIRNLACCQANSARSRAVKYFRAASPRANQNSDAPIIIVLSTSKNAAAVLSGTTAGGGSTSAAAAEAAPATAARVSSPGAALSGTRRPRNGRTGTVDLLDPNPPPDAADAPPDPSGPPRVTLLN